MTTSTKNQPDHEPSQLNLPTITPVHSTPSKKSVMKKRLSRMAFPFTSNDDQSQQQQQQLNYDFDNSLYSVDNTLLDSTTDEQSYIPHTHHDTSLSTQPSGINNSDSHYTIHKVHKFNRSNSSLANSLTSSLHKLPYKSSTSNLSSANILNQTSNPTNNGTDSTNNTNVNLNSNTSSNMKSINHPQVNYVSPNKNNPRYLATNNDHTFLLSKQPHSVLVPPTFQRQSHSQSSSINNLNDDSSQPLSSTTSNTTTNANINATAPKGIPPSALPQFSSINNTNNIEDHYTNVLAPPTVLTPAYRTNSATTQSTSHQLYGTANNSSILYSNYNNNHSSAHVPPSSISDTMSTTTTTTNTRQQKKGTGLLQNAYKSSHHQSHSNLSKDKDKNTNSNDTNNHNSNTNGEILSSNTGAQNDMVCLDSKHHFISPKITNQFKSLENLIQIGIKKRMEYLDTENTSLIKEINKHYEDLDSLYTHLFIQVEDLDSYIMTLRSKKKNDIKTLQQNGLFENLNDLTNRIDNVKKNMDDKKENLKMFEIKLDTLAKLKKNSEKRNRTRKNLVFIVLIVILLLFLLKLIICKFI